MNILIVPSWYTTHDDIMGNGGIFHYEQAKELAKNYRVAIYYPFDRTLKKDFAESEERGLATYRSKFIPSQRIRNRVRIYKAFKHIIEEFKPDIVHTHVATEAGRYAALWCSMFHIPFVVTEHATVEISGVDKKGLVQCYANFVYGRSKGNFCVSEDLRNKLSTIFPKYKFQVMYNGIDMPEHIERTKRYRVEGYHNIVFVAALYDAEIKGLQYLLPAIQKLIQQSCPIIFHLVGGGEYEEYFRSMAEKLGIADHVVFYGYCEKQKVYEIVGQMDFLVSASLVESFGCSIAEALLLGKPVIATRCGGPEGFVKDEVGVLVDKGSMQALYDGILTMIESKDNFQENRIRAYAQKRFDNHTICDKYTHIYSDIINKTKRN